MSGPDCLNCRRPLRAICETLAEEILQERQTLAQAPAHEQSRIQKELEVSERTQAQLWQTCLQPQCRGIDQPLAGLPRPHFLH
jgi:hypothetical protein